ncbi:MAG: class I SAM-dependent methyltransferase [Acidobacteriota bacterium]
MGYIFRIEDARRYDDWFKSETGRWASAIERELLLRVWNPSSAQRVLEVGCGTGLFLEWLAQKGHLVTGLDASAPMLDIARGRLPESIGLNRGFAEHLPYNDNEFDTVALVTSLEFVDDPMCALREALRVARRSVLLGVLNKYSVTSCQHYLSRFWKESTLNHARFFSLFELKSMAARALSGKVPLRWRTCLSLPLGALKYSRFIERNDLMQHHPFGHFIGMRIDLRYDMNTVQNPLFAEIPAAMRQTAAHNPCRHSLYEDKCYNILFQQTILPNAQRGLEIAGFP